MFSQFVTRFYHMMPCYSCRYSFERTLWFLLTELLYVLCIQCAVLLFGFSVVPFLLRDCHLEVSLVNFA